MGYLGKLLVFGADHLADDVDDVLGGEAVVTQDLVRGAGVAELILDADAAHDAGQLLADNSADSLAQAADDAVLLDGDDAAALAGGGQDDLLIDGLDGGHIDDADVHALALGQHGGAQCLVGHQAGGNDGDVVTVGQLLALADLELVGLRVMENRRGQAGKAQVDRALVVVGGDDGGAGLDIVGRADDDHSGDGAHQGDILAALVGGAVLTDRQAGVGGGNLHVQVRVADGVANLLKAAARHEHGEAGNKGHIAHRGHTGGDAHHVLLGNAAVKVALGVSLAENLGLGGGGQVGVKNHQIVSALLPVISNMPDAFDSPNI